jgi:hypothetical protein
LAAGDDGADDYPNIFTVYPYIFTVYPNGFTIRMDDCISDLLTH